MAGFELPEEAMAGRKRLEGWVTGLFGPGGASATETALLPDYLTVVFQDLLGYSGWADRVDGTYTIHREKLVEVDGKFADAVLGEFTDGSSKPVVALEGKGPRDPLERPFGGRKMSAVDQAYRYAINLPCDWLIVTNLREIRLYHKGSTQRSFERFVLKELVDDLKEFKRFLFILGAERVVPADGHSHLYDLLEESEKAGERLTREFYDTYADVRHELLNSLIQQNPKVDPTEVLGATQHLLDRTLFVAFAEDRSLLPSGTLAKAYEHHDPYNPRPVWENFRGLFRAIDEGSPKLSIPQYNGGLFAKDPLLDEQLNVPDESCQLLKTVGDYYYGAAREAEGDEEEGRIVDVEILGHIFEQSIEDLEAIRAEIEGGEASRYVSRRKREGAFYTPTFVTQYIVERALQPVLEQRFEQLRSVHQQTASGTSVSVLEDPRIYDVDSLNNPQRDALISFWEAWIEELKTIRVLDPACGSGAFLIELFDQLHVEYQQAADRLAELRKGEWAGSLFDPDRAILQNNIYGVDLNDEAIEIARLSIWIKTAQRGKVLTDLHHNIRIGNSIISDPSLDLKAFGWWDAFPEVAEQGGFDVVVGNPPYVRAEMLTELKPYLAEHYETYHGVADLYVYFFELGMRLLRPGGRLSYIVTNKWLKTGYAKPLRQFFAEKTRVEEIVDLGHAREVFPDADVFPSILRVRKPEGEEPGDRYALVSVIPREELAASDFAAQVRSSQFTIEQSRFNGESWSLDPPVLGELMSKMRRIGVPLLEFLGSEPKYGLKTGYNKAFLVTQEERDRMVNEDPGSRAVLKRYLRGQDIKRWHPEWAGLWMILLKSSGDHHWPWSGSSEDEAEAEFSRSLPVIHRHLKQSEERLRRRSDQGQYWWELRSCDYYEVFEHPKIIHTDITWRPEFAYVDEPTYLVNTAYMWPCGDLFLLGVMNSPLMWSFMWRNAQHGKDEALRMFLSFITTVPIAKPTDELRHEVTTRVRQLLTLSRERRRTRDVLHDWLHVEFGVTTPGRRLDAPSEIDPETFVSEVKKRRSGGSNLSAAELQRLRVEYEQTVRPLHAEARTALQLERDISDLVNGAYGLTSEEIDLLWRTSPPRTPKVRSEQSSSVVGDGEQMGQPAPRAVLR